MTDEEKRAVAIMARTIEDRSEGLVDLFRKLAESARRVRPQIGVFVCTARAMRRAETNARLQLWRERATAGELP